MAGDNAQGPTERSTRTASKSMWNGGSRITPREKSRIQLTKSMNGQWRSICIRSLKKNFPKNLVPGGNRQAVDKLVSCTW